MPAPREAIKIIWGYIRSFWTNVWAFYLMYIKPALRMIKRMIRL